MTEIPLHRILITLTLKQQPQTPSQLLAVPNFIRLKTKYTYNHNLKKYKDSTALANSYHKDLSETIQYILSYRKTLISLLTKENLKSYMLDN